MYVIDFTISTGRKALITGGASGIGLATAKKLAEAGIRVSIADLDQSQVDATCRSLGSSALGVRMDVTNRRSVQDAVARVEDEFGGLDTLVTCAGVFRFGEALSISEDDWDLTVDVNLKGTFLACQTCLPALRASKRGRIVTVSSISGVRGDDFASHYSASKFGVIGLTQSLAVENGRFGVTVNAVCPGTIPGTTMGQSSMAQKVELRKLSEGEIVQRDSSSLPLGRLGRAEDIADAITFLITENASWITGQALVVDGGTLLSPPSHHR
jgi:NAD(P)-dependent dehydrogenase (short-subunit alcohol dehydrogenase family)